jgi:glucose-6-phosphate isomerase
MTRAPFDDLVVDFSKQPANVEILGALIDLAKERGVPAAIEQLFRGDAINVTEGRPAVHVALRMPAGTSVMVDGHDVMPEVQAVRARMGAFVERVRAGEEVAADSGAFTDVVNIGIGGSDLGPRMVVEALAPYADGGPRVHHVSNVDGWDLASTLSKLDPRRTLLVVVSKTFTTLETMTNARTAQRWLVEGHGGTIDGLDRHLVAVTSATKRSLEFGVSAARTFGMWDWVGGRYSLWSSVGISIALAVGMEHFQSFLAGAHEMDEHFQSAPLEQNVPVLAAMLGIWASNVLGAPTHAILPYDERLRLLPNYLQQADMESNGKSSGLDGVRIEGFHTGPVVWGAAGTNAQHAFFQLIHQGTRMIPTDFLIAANPEHDLDEHHEILIANAFAQSQALMMGRDLDTARALVEAEGSDAALAVHRVFEGNRPSTMMLYERLTPRMLGRLLALYEHKIFVQGRVWGINSFDQWGVELGKSLAKGLLPAVRGGDAPTDVDGSTRHLLDHLRRMRSKR